MNFASDNVYGVHPKILAALAEVNGGTAPSYGGDEQTLRAEEKLKEVFGCDLRAFLVTSGTAANGLALSTMTPGFGAIFCNSEAHIAVDECNSPEMFTGGAKIIGLHGPAGKITPAMVEKALKGFIRGEHDPKPKGVSLTNASELGTVYSPAEVRAFSDLIRPRGMKLHMDGARFANAVAGLGCTPAELTWKSGVDVMSFGATKNGAMMLEAVVFFDRDLARVLHRPVRIENDANCLAVSEAVDGAGKGARMVFAAILGTGVGAGIAIDGRAWVGPHGIAGEWGHNPAPRLPEDRGVPSPHCWCGRGMCNETVLSGPGFAADHLRHGGGGRACRSADRRCGASARCDQAAAG